MYTVNIRAWDANRIAGIRRVFSGDSRKNAYERAMDWAYMKAHQLKGTAHRIIVQGDTWSTATIINPQ